MSNNVTNITGGIEKITEGIAKTANVEKPLSQVETLEKGVEVLKAKSTEFMAKAIGFGKGILAGTVERLPEKGLLERKTEELLTEENDKLKSLGEKFKQKLDGILEEAYPTKKVGREFGINQLEEDLAGFDEETLLPKEEKKIAVENACKDVLSKFGKHISPGRIQAVFPGIDIEHIDQYDFENANMRVFILDKETFHNVNVATNGGSSEKTIGRFVAPRGAYDKKYMPENPDSLSGISTIQGEYEGMLSKTNGRYKRLERTVRHEVLHNLMVGEYLKERGAVEGLVEYLTILTSPKSDTPPGLESIDDTNGRSFIQRTLKIIDAFNSGDYGTGVAAISSARNTVKNLDGWSNEKFFDCIISEDPAKHTELAEALIKNLGEAGKRYVQTLYDIYE